MHVVTGGAYNGKTAWVNNYYRMETEQQKCWFSAYQGDHCPESISEREPNLLVFSGVELWVKDWLQMMELEMVREYGKRIIQDWLDWEQQVDARQLVVIGSDISRGIVPLEKEMRDYRDAAGWFFQDLTAACSRLDLIWYGMNRQLK